MSLVLPSGAVPLGLGAMRLDGDGGLEILHRALDAGVRLIDTADVYGQDPREVGANERLVARALSSWRGVGEEVRVATKGGLVRRGKEWIPDGRAKQIKAACERSRRALGVERIFLYQLHAPDPKVPWATTLRALASLEREGKVEHVGLSNVTLEEIEAAEDVLEVASVQVSLSPLDLTPLKNGVAVHCMERGIALLAHSPLGGHRRRGRVGKERALSRIAERRGATAAEVALTWLRSLHPLVIPLPGATKHASLESILRAARLTLSEEDLAELDEAYPASRSLRGTRVAPAPEPDGASGEVVLFVGYPGAGKSALAQKWLDRGYERLNRDEEGGTLAALLPALDEELAAGRRRLVLDNTYPRRAARFDVVDTAWKHGVPVTCVWLQTSLERAQVNAVERMVARYGKLLSPEEMSRVVREDPNAFPPGAQFLYRRQLEPPRLEEGFQRIDTVEFARRPKKRDGRALFLDYEGILRKTRSGDPRPRDPDDVEVLPGRGDVLRRYRDDGYRLVAVSYQPSVPDAQVRACFERTHELLGVEIDVRFCPHPPGPAICWCRKPLPGLGVVLLQEHGLDPDRSLLVAGSAADRGFAERLEIPWVAAEEFFS